MALMPEERYEYDLKLLTLDAALANTGYAVFEISSGNFGFRLLDIGVIVTDPRQDEDSRLRYILNERDKIVFRNSINMVVLEFPSQAIYGSQKMNPKLIATRAGSVAQIKLTCGAIISSCHYQGMFCRTVFPSTWQAERGYRKEIHKDSKAWSTKEANKVLKLLKINKKLTTKHEANIADAINLAIFTITRLESKKWEKPNIKVA